SRLRRLPGRPVACPLAGRASRRHHALWWARNPPAPGGAASKVQGEAQTRAAPVGPPPSRGVDGRGKLAASAFAATAGANRYRHPLPDRVRIGTAHVGNELRGGAGRSLVELARALCPSWPRAR